MCTLLQGPDGRSYRGVGPSRALRALLLDFPELLEIVGISSIYKLGCIMGLNRAGVRGHRLCQVIFRASCCVIVVINRDDYEEE